MNRLGLGLAIGAGYVLGRTKKMKLAFAVGTMVAGKRLSPRALADLVSHQLRNNPQCKEMGDQLGEDLRGAGKAATGALREDGLEAPADHLHARTARMRDRLAGPANDGDEVAVEDPAAGRGPSPGDGDEVAPENPAAGGGMRGADNEAPENSAPPAFEERGLGRSPRWGSPRSSEAESGGGTGRGGGGEKPRSSHDTPEDEPQPPRKLDDIAEGKGPLRSALEQVLDDRLTWTSQSAKGTTKGAVSFHPLADNLTRILLVSFARFEEDIDEEPYEDEDVERATVGGSRR